MNALTAGHDAAVQMIDTSIVRACGAEGRWSTVFARQNLPANDQPPHVPVRAGRCPGLAASLLCRQARLAARDMLSSLGRNSEQNDTNRGNPFKAISIRIHDN